MVKFKEGLTLEEMEGYLDLCNIIHWIKANPSAEHFARLRFEKYDGEGKLGWGGNLKEWTIELFNNAQHNIYPIEPDHIHTPVLRALKKKGYVELFSKDGDEEFPTHIKVIM